MAAGLAWSGSSLASPDLYPQPESCDRTPPSRVRTSDYTRTVTILSIKSRQIPVIFLYRVVIYVDRVTTCAWPTSIHRCFIQKTGQWRPVHMIYLVSGQVTPLPPPLITPASRGPRLTPRYRWGEGGCPGGQTTSPARHWTNAVLLLSQRRRRWASIKTALGYCLFFAGSPSPPRNITHSSLLYQDFR